MPSFIVTDSASNVVAGTLSFPTPTTVVFTQSSPLVLGGGYSVKLTTDIKDSAGTPMASDFVFSFTVAAADAAPEVVTTVPAPFSINVPASQPITITFSKDIDPTTVTN